MQKITAILIICVFSIIAGCDSDIKDPGNILPRTSITGVVFDGPLINATVSAYTFDQGVIGELLDSTMSDSKGTYTLLVKTLSRPILIRAAGEGAYYYEEASGNKIYLLPSQFLETVTLHEDGRDATVHMTHMTTLAACLTRYKHRNSTESITEIITESNSIFSAIAGADILNIQPALITNSEYSNSSAILDEKFKLGFNAAGLSNLTADISVFHNQLPHARNQFSSIYFTMVACNDIESDGLLDGKGTIPGSSTLSKQLAIGSRYLSADTYRADLGRNIITIANSPNNKTSLTGQDLLIHATSVANDPHPIFGVTSTKQMDSKPPGVTSAISTDFHLKGIVDMPFIVSDAIGVSELYYKIDNGKNISMDPKNTTFQIDTSVYSDGFHTITITARDLLMNESIVTFNYYFNNTTPIVNINSSLEVNNAFYAASGGYSAEGSSINSIKVNNQDALIDTSDNSWSIILDLIEGKNVFEVVIIDDLGISNRRFFEVGLDLSDPIITPVPSGVRYSTTEGNNELCVPGVLTLGSAETDPICIQSNMISLSGTPVSPDLIGLGFAVIEFDLEDPITNGIWTQKTDLNVEYQYAMNDTVKANWRPLPRPQEPASRYLLPLVTEYLTNDWYNSTPTDTHTLTIRATDSTGNIAFLSWNLSIEIFNQISDIDTEVLNKEIFDTATFDTRSTLDGNTLNIQYTFTNLTDTDLFLTPTLSNRHSVSHTYETVVRKNRARIVSTEEWRSRFRNIRIWNYYGGVTNVYGCTAGPVSSVTYSITNGINAWDGNNWKIIFPPTHALGNWGFVIFDTPSPSPATAWVTTTPSTTHADTIIVGNTDVYDYTPLPAYNVVAQDALQKNPLDSLMASYVTAYGSAFPCSLDFNYLEKRTIFSYELDSAGGFPKNISKTKATDYTIITDALTVYDTGASKVVSADTSNRYLISAGEKIRITRSITLPAILHYTDSSVADLNTFSSYSPQSLDKETVWTIDTDAILILSTSPDNTPVTLSLYRNIVGLGLLTKVIDR